MSNIINKLQKFIEVEEARDYAAAHQGSPGCSSCDARLMHLKDVAHAIGANGSVLVPIDLLERAIKLLSGDGIALITHEQKVAHYIAECDAARDLRSYLPDY